MQFIPLKPLLISYASYLMACVNDWYLSTHRFISPKIILILSQSRSMQSFSQIFDEIGARCAILISYFYVCLGFISLCFYVQEHQPMSNDSLVLLTHLGVTLVVRYREWKMKGSRLWLDSETMCSFGIQWRVWHVSIKESSDWAFIVLW